MKVQRSPKVSIGLPVFNGENFLSEAIESILAQTFEDFEFIISDNASIDGTEKICRDYARREQRIKYFRNKENLGAAWNFNRVFDLSSGQYFKWATHDDLCAPTFLERCLEVFEESPPSVVLCYPRTKVIDEKGSLLWEHWQDLGIHEPKPHKRLCHMAVNLAMPPNILFGLIRSDVLARTRGIGTYVSSDFVTLAELFLLGEFREVPEFLFYLRFHGGASRQANITDQEVAEWFLPGSGNQLILEYWTVFFQHLLAIKLSPISHKDKFLCFLTFPSVWIKVWRKCLMGEISGLCKFLIRRERGIYNMGRV